MKSILTVFIIAVTLLVTSCGYQEVKYLGVSNISNVGKKDNKINVDVDFKIDNPNTYTIKIKPSKLDVFLNDKKIGIVHLDEKVKLVKKKEGVYTTKLVVELENINLMNLITNALFGKTSLSFRGQVKAGTSFLTKKFHVDETRDLDLKEVQRLAEKFS